MGAVTGRRHATGAVHLAVPILAPPTVNTLTGRPPSAVPRTTNQAFSQQDRPAIMQRARPRRHDADQAMGYQYSLPLHPLVTPFLNMNLLYLAGSSPTTPFTVLTSQHPATPIIPLLTACIITSIRCLHRGKISHIFNLRDWIRLEFPQFKRGGGQGLRMCRGCKLKCLCGAISSNAVLCISARR